MTVSLTIFRRARDPDPGRSMINELTPPGLIIARLKARLNVRSLPSGAALVADRASTQRQLSDAVDDHLGHRR